MASRITNSLRYRFPDTERVTQRDSSRLDARSLVRAIFRRVDARCIPDAIVDYFAPLRGIAPSRADVCPAARGQTVTRGANLSCGSSSPSVFLSISSLFLENDREHPIPRLSPPPPALPPPVVTPTPGEGDDSSPSIDLRFHRAVRSVAER